jgi:hypothetical protein
MHLVRAQLLLAVALATSACQPAHDAPADAVDPLCIADIYGDTAGEIPFEDIERAFDEASCKAFVRCGHDPDEATCLARLASYSLVSPELEADIREGTVTYSARHAKACFDSISAQPCLRTDAELKKRLQRCGGMFEGTVRNGGRCRSDSECISQDCDDSCTCKGDTPPFVQACLGGTCTGVRGCDDNMYCERGRCVPALTRGENCFEASYDSGQEYPCQAGLACVWVADSAAICEPLNPVSQACVYGECGLGAQCDPTTDTCQPRRQLGEACVATDQCRWELFCDSNTGTCTQRPSVGQPCTLESWCVDARCDLDTLMCVEMPLEGSFCP